MAVVMMDGVVPDEITVRFDHQTGSPTTASVRARLKDDAGNDAGYKTASFDLSSLEFSQVLGSAAATGAIQKLSNGDAVSAHDKASDHQKEFGKLIAAEMKKKFNI